MAKSKGKSSKPILILFVVQFLVMVGFGIVIPILPFLVSKMGGTPLSLGIFMAAYSIMQFFFAPFWGRLSDRIGRKPVLLIGLAGYGLTFILLGLATKLWILIAIRALSGVVSSATLPTAMAYLADSTEEGPERSKAMGMVGAAMGLGMIFGPALGGWLGHYSFATPFFMAGILALVVMPFAWIFLQETIHAGEAKPSQTRPRLTLEVVKDPMFVIFVFNFFISFTMAMYESTFAYLAAAKVGFGTKEMGLTFTVAGIAGVIIQGGLIGKLVKKFGDAKLVISGALICALGLLFILWSGTATTIILATVVYMCGSSLMGPTSSSLVSKHAKNGQGVSMGFFQSFGSLGRILGPIIGGLLYGKAMGLPYIAGAFLLVAMILVGGPNITGYSLKPSTQRN